MPNKKRRYTVEEQQFFKNIGFKVQFFRKKCDMSQFQLAEKADLSQATIGHLESTNVHVISLVSLYRIAKALGVSPDQLLKFD